MPFLKAANEVLEARGVTLPLEGQATTTLEDRLEKGAQAQADWPHMLEAWKQGTINRWLAANCFWRLLHPHRVGLKPSGNGHLLLPGRQGGVQNLSSPPTPKGNMNLGNGKEFLTKVVSQCLPYIGYPPKPERYCLHQQSGGGISCSFQRKWQRVMHPLLFLGSFLGTVPTDRRVLARDSAYFPPLLLNLRFSSSANSRDL